MKKSLFLFVALAIGFSANAQTKYFFSPEGNGDADGSSWENAAAGEYLGTTIAEAEVGDEFYLMEGKYAPDGTTNKWNIAQGVIIKGGYPTTMTGTNTDIDYTTAGQSVFSADLDNDGKGDNKDYAFVYVGLAGQEGEKKDGQFYKDAPLTQIWGVTFRDGARQDGKYWGNMLFAKHTKLDLHFCKFINNIAPEAQNNAALVVWGSQVRVFDCVFEGNRSPGAGSAVLIRARESNSSNTDEAGGALNNTLALFERCEFTDNATTGNYGGTLSLADTGGTLYMINCTVTAGTVNRGGVIALGGAQNDGSNAPQAYLINNTFVNNVGTDKDKWVGGAYRAGQFSTTYFANNIMVNPAAADNYNSNKSVVEIQYGTCKVQTAGYNIFGTMNLNGAGVTFATTDKLTTSADDVNTQEKIFGTSVLANNGGFSQSFMPLAEQATSLAVADLQTAVAAWNMEKAVTDVMDLTVDQRGYKRAATTMSGSVDVNAQAPADEKVSVTGVTLDQTELTIVVPQTATLVATVAPADATNNAVKWTSDKEEVATVENGVVTAVAEGTANITVTTVDGEFTATCVVTVKVADGVLDIQVLDKTAPMYDVLGRQVDNNYHGVVIQNGTTFFL